ncbi:MAG: hypothetical protein ACXW3J_05950 [Methylocystis sp.]
MMKTIADAIGLTQAIARKANDVLERRIAALEKGAERGGLSYETRDMSAPRAPGETDVG